MSRYKKKKYGAHSCFNSRFVFRRDDGEENKNISRYELTKLINLSFYRVSRERLQTTDFPNRRVIFYYSRV